MLIKTKLRSIVIIAIGFGILLVNFLVAAGASPSENERGPCMIKRTRLPRLDPVKVGHVRQMVLIPGEKLYTVTTLSVKPPIFEIPNFLSDSETEQLLNLAENGKLESSDVYHHSADSLTDTMFELWDFDEDGVVSPEEIITVMRYIRDLHFTKDDVQKMLDSMNSGKVKKGEIHRSEFRATDIMLYIEKVGASDSHVKGRHSNQTFIYGPGYEQVATTLNLKKAALTGLPIEIIEGSETPVVVKYGPSGHYHCHYDSHQQNGVGKTCCDRGSLHECRICRYITILYFLNDVEEGGQTAFPVANNHTFNRETWPSQTNYLSNLSAYCFKANLRITPKRGTAVMWYNHVIDKTSNWLSELDFMSYHGGCDVIRGHKWIVNNWINVIGQNWDDVRTWRDKNKRVGPFKSELKQ